MAKTTESTEPVDLVERHKAFKLRAAEALHRYADELRLCATFDEIMHGVGLPARERAYDQGWIDRPSRRRALPVGEATEEEFETWKVETSKELHRQAKRYGVISGFDDVIRETGLPVREFKTVKIVIEGTFKVPYHEVEVDKDDDRTNLIDRVDRYAVRERIWNAFDTDRLTWKAVIDDDGEHESTEVVTDA